MPVIILDPTDGPREAGGAVASRPATLDGKIIGIIDNGKRNSRYVLALIAENLQRKYNLKEIVFEKKQSASLPIKADQAEKLAGNCDIVLAGVGD